MRPAIRSGKVLPDACHRQIGKYREDCRRVGTRTGAQIVCTGRIAASRSSDAIGSRGGFQGGVPPPAYLSPHQAHYPARPPSGLVETHDQPLVTRAGKASAAVIDGRRDGAFHFRLSEESLPAVGKAGPGRTVDMKRLAAGRIADADMPAYWNRYLFRANPVFHKPISNSI